MTIKPSKQYPPPVRRARATLKKRGYSQRAAARALGVHHQHLWMVLSGRRQSQRLLKRISLLPPTS